MRFITENDPTSIDYWTPARRMFARNPSVAQSSAHPAVEAQRRAVNEQYKRLRRQMADDDRLVKSSKSFFAGSMPISECGIQCGSFCMARGTIFIHSSVVGQCVNRNTRKVNLHQGTSTQKNKCTDNTCLTSERFFFLYLSKEAWNICTRNIKEFASVLSPKLATKTISSHNRTPSKAKWRIKKDSDSQFMA